jgi:ABC-type branched-subunit amino acid transport system substrate-binding protein
MNPWGFVMSLVPVGRRSGRRTLAPHRRYTRSTVGALLAVVVLVAAACGGGAEVDDSSSGGGGGSQTTEKADTSSSDAKCKDVTLEATDVGVTPETITVAVIADTGSSFRPGLFQGSVDGVKAWADYRNANGGIGCRQIEVKEYDSKISPADTKNALLAACGEAVSTVGTTALFLNDVTPIEQCPDKSGAATGLPDIAVTQSEPVYQCSPVSFGLLPVGGTCPYAGSGERDYTVNTGPFDSYFKEYGEDALHGTWVIPKDTPSTISASMPGFRASQEMGIKRDAEIGASGLDTQSAYTPIAQQMKEKGSTYGRNGLDYKGTVFLRKEAEIQGVDTVKVWDCSLQCYDQRLISEGGTSVEGQYMWMSFLPFEDKGSNDTLDAFLEYNEKPDGFGAQAFLAGELFAQVVDGIVEADGPNAVTRANILEGLRNTHEFDGGGMMTPTDIGARKQSTCYVLMQVKDGEFVRANPTKPGTFDCTGKPYDITLDPITAFQG